MNLVKTSFYTAISTAINFIAGFIVIKVVAVKIGPVGIAYVGQFQSTTSILSMLATAAITTGVVKYLAQHKEDPEKSLQIINTAFIIIFFSSLIVSVAVMATSGILSAAVFKTKDLWKVYFLSGLFIMMLSMNALFTAILNGLKEIRKLTIVNICTSLIGVGITVLSAYTFGLEGVLLSATAAGIIIFFINLFLIRRSGIMWKPDFKTWDKKMGKMLLAFSLMTIVSGFLTPASQILVRDHIIERFSATDAGYWQAVTKISDYYLAFITTVLSVYYMPRLSEISGNGELRAEIAKAYKIVLPVVGAIALLIWILKSVVIYLLFTPQFSPMKPLFAWQLLGDFFKIGSWLMAYLMVAKAMVRLYIITEIAFAISYVSLSYIFMNSFGVIGATYSFCVNYVLYWIVIWLLLRKKISGHVNYSTLNSNDKNS